MRILHVLGKERNAGAEAGFMDLVAILEKQGCAQSALLFPHRTIEAALERKNVPFTKAKFAGLFDLQTVSAAQQLAASLKPEIVIGHSADTLKLHPKIINLPALLAVGALPPAIAIEDTAEPISRIDVQTPKDVFVIGTLASLTPGRHISKVIQSIRDIPSCHYWIGGEGPDLKKLQDMAAVQGLSNRVHFMGPQTNRLAFLSALNACIVPARANPPDRNLAEAWAAGVPAICGLEDKHIPSGSQDAMVKVNGTDVLAWKKAIQDVVGNDVLRVRLKKSGTDFFQKALSPAAVGAAYIAYFKKTLALQT